MGRAGKDGCSHAGWLARRRRGPGSSNRVQSFGHNCATRRPINSIQHNPGLMPQHLSAVRAAAFLMLQKLQAR
jgi:hypothetical protein